MVFFELRGPRDIFEKAERELVRLRNELNIDNVFNFFVTAYHIKDYVEKDAAAPQRALEAFLKDPDLRACRDLCDKGKHLRLTKRPDPATAMWDSTVGGAPIGVLPIGGGEMWVLFSDGRDLDVQALAESIIDKYRSFFHEHGI